MKIRSLLLRTLLIILLLFSLGSCHKSDPRPDYPAGSQENINSWVLDSMKVYYYWNTSLPGRPDLSQDPSAFFKGIKNGADRFSALVNPDLPETYPPSLVHTVGFDLLTVQTSDGAVETIISLVVTGSRAADQGLLRGDVVTAINGTTPTAGNIAQLTEKMITDQSANLSIAGRTGTVPVQRLISEEEPVYTYKVFQSGGKTFGYLFLNSFEEPAVNQLQDAFTYFKQHQVQELLLDLRYNPGGSVPVAASLAAMIAPGASEGNTFVAYRGNSNAGSRASSFAAEISKLSSSVRRSFSQFAGYRLGISRIYIFTGSHTASAAELLINALKPYITVIQLGKQSLGKDMASFLIKDYRNPQIVQKWEIYPMIFKLYNAAGKGDYSGGLVPDQSADELSALPLKPFGDLTDPLIQRCLVTINPGTKARIRNESVTNSAVVLFDSRDKTDLNSAGVTILRP